MTNRDRRERRRERRRRRWRQAERESRRNMLFMTVTVLSFASFMISMAKAVFKFPSALPSAVDFFLVSAGLIVLGSLMLWGVYAKASRWNMAALLVVAMLTAPIAAYFGVSYRSTIEPAREELVRDPRLPWGSEVPEVDRALFQHKTDFILVIDDDESIFGLHGSIPSRDSNRDSANPLLVRAETADELVEPARMLVERHAHEISWMSDTRLSVQINADRCTPTQRVIDFEEALVASGFHEIRLGVVDHNRVGSYPFRSGEDLDGWRGAVVTVLPDRIELQLPDQQPQTVLKCPGDTRCTTVESCGQSVVFDELRDAFADYDGDGYVLSVDSEVTIGITIKLIDSLNQTDGAQLLTLTVK